MYTDFFGLNALPFSNTPDPRFFFKTPEHEEALARMQYCLGYHKGMLAVTGQAGTGKTLLTRLFLVTQPPATNVALILHPQLSSSDLLREIAREFGVDSLPTDSISIVAARLQEFLIEQRQRGQSPLVIIDEAHTLPSDAYDALRILSNLEVADSKLVDIFLFGQPSLQRNLISPALCELHQRLFSSVSLKNLDQAQTEQYIKFRLECAGAGDRPIFESETFSPIYHYSGGFPRLINQACDNSLLTAFSAESEAVTLELVNEVIEQMSGLRGLDPPPVTIASDGFPTPPHAADSVSTAPPIHHDADIQARIDAALAHIEHKESELEATVEQLDERLAKANSAMAQLDASNDEAAIAQVDANIQRLESIISDAASLADRLVDEKNEADATIDRLSQASGQGGETVNKLHVVADQEDERLAERIHHIIDVSKLVLDEFKKSGEATQDQAADLDKKIENAQATSDALESVANNLRDGQAEAEHTLSQLAEANHKSDGVNVTLRQHLEDVKDVCDQSWSTVNDAKEATEALSQVTTEAIDAQLNAQGLVDRLPEAQRLLDDMQAVQSQSTHQIQVLQTAIDTADARIDRSAEQNRQAAATSENLRDSVNQAEQTTETLAHVTAEAAEVQQNAQGLIDRLPEARQLLDTLQTIQDQSIQQIQVLQTAINTADARIDRCEDQNQQAETTSGNLRSTVSQAEQTTETLAHVTAEAAEMQQNAQGLIDRLPDAQRLLVTLQTVQDQSTLQIEVLQNAIDTADARIDSCVEQNQRAETASGNLRSTVSQAEQTTETLAHVTAEAAEMQQSAQGLIDQLPDAQQLLDTLQTVQDQSTLQIEVLQNAINTADVRINRCVEQNQRAETTSGNLHDAANQAQQATETLTRVTAEAVEAQHNAEGLTEGLTDQLPEARQLLDAMQTLQDQSSQQIEGLQNAIDTADARIDRSAEQNRQAAATSENLRDAANQAQQTTETLTQVTAEAVEAQHNAEGLTEGLTDQLPEARQLLDAMQTLQDQSSQQIEGLQNAIDTADARIDRSAEQNRQAAATSENLRDAANQAQQTTETLTQVTAEAVEAQHNAEGLTEGLTDQLPEARQLLDAMQTLQDQGTRQTEVLQEAIDHADVRMTGFADQNQRAEATFQSLHDVTDRAEGAVWQATQVEQKLPDLIAKAGKLIDQLPRIESALTMYAQVEDKLNKKIKTLQSRLNKVDHQLESLETATQQAQTVGESLVQNTERGQTTVADLNDTTDHADEKADRIVAVARKIETQHQQIVETAQQGDQICAKMQGDLQTLRLERNAIRKAVKASRNLLGQIADTDKILETKLETYRARQLEAHQQSAALKQQLEDLSQHHEELHRIEQKIQGVDAKLGDTANKLNQLDASVEAARCQVVALLAEPDRILASIKTQIDRMLQVADVSKKVHASISKASLNANRQLHHFRDLTSALDERMQKFSFLESTPTPTRSRHPASRNRLADASAGNVIKTPAGGRTPPAFARNEAGLITETTRS